MRPASFYLALLATLTEQSAAAIGHFDTALDVHERLEARTFLAPTRYECARMLLARDEDADRERALGLLDLALSTADTLGMAAVARGIRTLLAGRGDGAGKISSVIGCRARPLQEPVSPRTRILDYRLRRFGHAASGRQGLRYLARLLANPGREFHALDLEAAEPPAASAAARVSRWG
jgi:hypothetical protein